MPYNYEYDKKWHFEHPEQTRLSKRKWAKTHQRKLHQKKHIEHPEQEKVMQFIKRHRKDFPIAEYCETCPPEEVNKATDHHHPDYDYPTIYVSCCRPCHYYLNRCSDHSINNNC